MRSILPLLVPFLVAAGTLGLTTSPLSKREMVARDALLDSLPQSVRDDMIARGLGSIELDLEPWLSRDDEGGHAAIVKRGEGEPNEPGIKHCVDGQTAMTYDDGPYTYSRELTDLYANAGMHITYFVNVNNFNCNYLNGLPEALQYARTKKMTIASHTATHPHMLTLTHDQVDKQIQLTNEYLWKTVGVLPKFLRMPYGETNQSLNDYIWKKHRLHIIQWSTDSGDADNLSVKESVKRIKASTPQGGEIILNHETHESSVRRVAPQVIRFFKQKDIKSVGMKKCLGHKKAYKARRNAEARSASWNCDNVPAPGQS